MRKDDLSQLFQERFQGHESPVDPALWDAIQARVDALPAADGDPVGELFRERFQGHEVHVDPSAWTAIGQQLGHGAAAGGAGTGLLGGYGWVAAAVGTLLVGGAAYLFLSPEATPIAEQKAPTEVLQPVPATTAVEQEHVALPVENTAATTTTASTPRSTAATGEHAVERMPSAQTPVERITPLNTAPAPAPVPTPMPEAAHGPELVERIITQLASQAEQEVLAQMPERPAVSPFDEKQRAPEGDEPEEVAAPETAELPKLYLPDIFTPNGDGVNDTYEVKGVGFRTIMVRVFSVQRDQLVFSTNNGEPWTGENCPDGMYLVAVEALTEDGRSVTEGKVLWLNRIPLH